MSLAAIGNGDTTLFATKRTGRTPTVIEPKLLSQVTKLLNDAGIVQGQEFYTATVAETEAYNGQRETSAKNDGREVPAPIGLVAMAIRNARKAATPFEAYVIKAIDDAAEGSALSGKTHSLRFVNQGTDDNPRVLWAFVLANPRKARAK